MHVRCHTEFLPVTNIVVAMVLHSVFFPDSLHTQQCPHMKILVLYYVNTNCSQLPTSVVAKVTKGQRVHFCLSHKKPKSIALAGAGLEHLHP